MIFKNTLRSISQSYCPTIIRVCIFLIHFLAFKARTFRNARLPWSTDNINTDVRKDRFKFYYNEMVR